MAGRASFSAVTHAVAVRATTTVGTHSNLVAADSLIAPVFTCRPALREHARQAGKESEAAHAAWADGIAERT